MTTPDGRPRDGSLTRTANEREEEFFERMRIKDEQDRLREFAEFLGSPPPPERSTEEWRSFKASLPEVDPESHAGIDVFFEWVAERLTNDGSGPSSATAGSHPGETSRYDLFAAHYRRLYGLESGPKWDTIDFRFVVNALERTPRDELAALATAAETRVRTREPGWLRYASHSELVAALIGDANPESLKTALHIVRPQPAAEHEARQPTMRERFTSALRTRFGRHQGG